MSIPLLPPALDIHAMLRDLNQWGWRDYKIEIACGWNKGYVSQVKCGNLSEMFYSRAVRLHNFWATEQSDHAVSRGTLPINHLESTYESA
jgi:hypothetical protein